MQSQKEKRSEILEFDKMDIHFNREEAMQRVKEFIKDKDIFNMRNFEDDKKLCVAIIWEE